LGEKDSGMSCVMFFFSFSIFTDFSVFFNFRCLYVLYSA
jgi:hypothetical protein